MNTYLAGIAARNNMVEHSAFMSMLPSPTVAQHDADAMDIVENWSEIEQSKGIGQPDNQVIYHHPSLPEPKNIIPPETGRSFQESEQKVQYISRHVERMRSEEIILEKHSSPPSQTQSPIETPFAYQNAWPSPNDPLRERDGPKLKREEHDILPRMTPSDEKETSPAPGQERDDFPGNRHSPAVSVSVPAPIPVPAPGSVSLKSSPGGHTVQEIMPRIPDPFSKDKQRLTGESKNQQGPKLVIGKITVEIVPPPASQPQKVITRIVQKPADENNGRMNRLGIGLGQM